VIICLTERFLEAALWRVSAAEALATAGRTAAAAHELLIIKAGDVPEPRQSPREPPRPPAAPGQHERGGKGGGRADDRPVVHRRWGRLSSRCGSGRRRFLFFKSSN